MSRKQSRIAGYSCLGCRSKYPWGPTMYLCPACGQNLEIELDYERLRGKISRESLARAKLPGHWRFLPLLPLDTPPPVLAKKSNARSPLGSVGATPLYRSRGLEQRLKIGPIYLKDETRQPSASLKDRASSVVIARGLEEGAKVFSAASTGNAGASLACMGASTGATTVIFVPRTAPRAKVAQLQTFGAHVVLIDGSYDTCFDLCGVMSREHGWFNRSTGVNPVTREGKKTCAFEIALDLDFEVPELVIVSVGDGNILSGLGKGFVELKRLGLIDRMPKMVGIQSERSNAIFRAWREQKPVRAVEATTRADSISVDLPRDAAGALAALERSEGFMMEVSDEEILRAVARLGRDEGIFAEPAAACAVAGLIAMVEQGRLKRDRSVALVITGSGLKDVDAALSVSTPAPIVAPSVAAISEALARDGVLRG